MISDVLIPFVDQIAKEITLYRSEAQLDIDGNPLIWWKAKVFSYPNLSKLAKCYLAIPATSVASEHIFSSAGDVVTAQRAVLDSENVNKLIFIKKKL